MDEQILDVHLVSNITCNKFYVSEVPFLVHHLPSVHEEGPLGDFSCQTLEHTQLFGQLNQYLNPLFQQQGKYNLKGNQKPISAYQPEIIRGLKSYNIHNN